MIIPNLLICHPTISVEVGFCFRAVDIHKTLFCLQGCVLCSPEKPHLISAPRRQGVEIDEEKLVANGLIHDGTPTGHGACSPRPASRTSLAATNC
jgi:hypothetical protein